MPTTSNFGWTTPADTDLVKDGALAIRTLGNGIDTSMAELKGGTTGQVLSKTSNTDMDFTWVTTDDANAIQNAIVDAKGDLITATAADTPARLAVGNNGETLIADSTASTGLKWAKSPNFVGVSLANSTAQTIANATNTYLTWNTENIDTDGFHSTVSNTERITIPTGLGGKYLVSVQMRFHVNASGDRLGNIVVNGTTVYDVAQYVGSSAQYVIAARSIIMNLNAGDYIAFRVYQSSGGNLDHYARSSVEIEGFSAQFLGA